LNYADNAKLRCLAGPSRASLQRAGHKSRAQNSATHLDYDRERREWGNEWATKLPFKRTRFL